MFIVTAVAVGSYGPVVAFEAASTHGVSNTDTRPIPTRVSNRGCQSLKPSFHGSASGVLRFGTAYRPVSTWRHDEGDLDRVPSQAEAAYMPCSLSETIDAARKSVKAAIASGASRVSMEIPLPLIGKSDLDDWPGGISQQYIAAKPVIKEFLSGFPSGTGHVPNSLLDIPDSVAVWKTNELILIVFPSSDCLKKVRGVVEEAASVPVVLLNVQWRREDFGWGKAKEEAVSFVDSFALVYSFKPVQVKTGITSKVQAAIQYSFGNRWEVFRVDDDGRGECVASDLPERPTMQALVRLFSASSDGPKQSLFDLWPFGRKQDAK
eukprot:CAMPEP_0196653728 /NCGR_PEP_ID=MMETSP1086-20130531/3376_1 /TAXON_ID=77921 /ORGANISM="Cyanoptyche  gloeocystis , Strain SAG4.97" /LENGTH=320 /DNA_ID=CAMNT_0041985069 /DNA_START=86 /DNA_END=1048 /DNA_ORIENTATION=-